MKTFRDVIALWPSMSELARDVDAPIQTVAAWKRRDRIPDEYWNCVLDAAKSRKLKSVTPAVLIGLAAKKRPEPEPASC